MTSSKKETKEEVKVNQPDNAPTAPTNTPISQDTLSHRWQENSAALDTNELAGYSAPVTNVLDAIDTPEKVKARKEEEKKEQETTTALDYELRTKLDVSDPRYINPSLDHVKKAK